MRISSARALLCALPAVAVIAAAAPAAQAAAVTAAIPETCKLYDTAGTYSGASFVFYVELQGELPDSVAQGSPLNFTGVHATVSASNAAVNVMRAFGTAFSASITEFDVDATNTSSPITNLIPAPVAIPEFPLPPATSSDPAISFPVPLTGTVSASLGTATGAVGSTVDIRVAELVTRPLGTVKFTRTDGAADYSGSLRCRATPFDDEDTVHFVFARIPITAPVIVAQGPAITKVQGTGIAGIGGFGVITGQRLTGVTAVTVGGKRASNVRKVGTFVTFSAPKLAAGTYDVAVTTPAGTSPASAGAKLRYIKLGF
jgi:hypothetical protein